MTTRCEDYPCCGHTDGLGCNWTPESVHNDPHLLCDHNTGFCEVEDEEPDDYDDDHEPEDCPYGGCSACDDWVDRLAARRDQAEQDRADAMREDMMFDRY